MKKHLYNYFLLLLPLYLISCGDQKCGYKPDNVISQTDIEIKRLESEILSLSTKEEISAFMQEYPVIANNFLLKDQYPNDSIFLEEMYRRFTNPHIDSLRMEIETVFKDISWLEKDLEEAFDIMRYYYPETKVPEIMTVATGFDYDMMVTDTLIVIGLDYYMGKEAKYRPMETYNYILKRYEPKYIVPSIMLLSGISPTYNRTNKQDATMLADMISYGKAFYFAKRMLPCTADSTLIWYSSEEMEGLKENQEVVWAHFIEKELLWETDRFIIRKYTNERPKTFEIGPECPPRISTWLGWQIVKNYMENEPNVDLLQLMQKTDAKEIFQKAKYRPD